MNSLGLLESRTLAGGVELLDVMVKAADIEILRATTICSGRFMILAQGDESAVETALNAAKEKHAKPPLIYHITGVSTQVLSFLQGKKAAPSGSALGVIETRRAISTITAADIAVKQANVEILRLNLGQGINGKGWLLLGGDVAAMEESVAAATEGVQKELLDWLILPSPDDKVWGALSPTMLKTRAE